MNFLYLFQKKTNLFPNPPFRPFNQQIHFTPLESLINQSIWVGVEFSPSHVSSSISLFYDPYF